MRVYRVEEDVAWDICYKALFRIAEKNDQYIFENEKKRNAFVFRVFINYLKNHFRDQKNKLQEVELNVVEHVLHENEKEEQQTHPSMLALENELALLQDWERMLLLLRSQEMSYADISRYIDKPEEQLKVYYQRLKKKLTERLNAALVNQQK